MVVGALESQRQDGAMLGRLLLNIEMAISSDLPNMTIFTAADRESVRATK